MDMYNVDIVVSDGNGQIICSQPYDEFTYGTKDIEIQKIMYGRQLYDLLVDELNVIRYSENGTLILGVILQSDINRTAMQLLGRIAEAIIVRNCHNNIIINQEYFSIARQKRAKEKTARKFYALGTGLNYTKINYPKHYNPSDTQRDIVWTNDVGELTIMKNQDRYSTISAKIAGLQIKATKNGIKYVLPDIIQGRYDVPIIYFDIENDYHKILAKVYKDTNVDIEYDIIHPNAIDPRGYEEFLHYVDLVYAMVDGKLHPADLVIGADKSDDILMKNALLSTTLSNINKPNRILI
ncbi:hypothetical protein D1841_09735 [Neglecta sp. X4]|uniref:hypothetical protein n=1 Tax=unclassified Neglectibacter TaxID=2632164 RepID=UPI00136E07C5|nr:MULTISPECIES: hypothetical protein [unclassified Neglectibacter]NBI17973.1 hypothetical protein [Neglectibacter sp. 59]NBJ73570.1 hypothetical protein [Neglectibacter sp. X4]NCE81355.1 hypothetical protein [Neglectibacter sp. X58]